MTAPTTGAAEAIAALSWIRWVIANDGYVVQFQTMGQYRTWLLKLIDEHPALASPPARGEATCGCDFEWDASCPRHGENPAAPAALGHEYEPRDCGGFCIVCGDGKRAHSPVAPAEGEPTP